MRGASLPTVCGVKSMIFDGPNAATKDVNRSTALNAKATAL